MARHDTRPASPDAGPDPAVGSALHAPTSGKRNGVGRDSVFDLYVPDPQLEDEGVWFTHAPSGKQFKIARAENARHMALLDQMGETRLRALENREMPEAERVRERARIAGIGLLRDWDDSFAEPFSADVAVELLAKATHLTNWIYGRAMEYQHYLGRAREADSKN